jgi:hypothetical protein
MGVLDDTVQLETGTEKVGGSRSDRRRDELTQLHIMDTWKAMDPSKISREEQMKVLL